MRAVVWHGRRDVRVETVPDPTIDEPTDAIVRITSTGLCGSDLHLYEVMGPFMTAGDILGHEPMGIVEAVGSGVTHIAPGDRVVIPFNISCGHCGMCDSGLQSQCETTQVREHDKGAALFGYTKLYGQVAGGQAELLRVPQAHYGPIKVPRGSAGRPVRVPLRRAADGMAGGPVRRRPAGRHRRRARPRPDRLDGVSRRRPPRRVPGHRRRPRPRAAGAGPAATVPTSSTSREFDDDRDDVATAIRDLLGTSGPRRGHRCRRHGGPRLRRRPSSPRQLTGAAARPLTEKLMQHAGVDRLAALQLAIEVVRRGGTISLSGVYGGMTDPLPMMVLFDKQIQLRMGQANVKRWIDDLLPLVVERDVLGVEDFASHHLPLEDAPDAYEMFQKKTDGAVKIIFQPAS